jgi:hypothetical protein
MTDHLFLRNRIVQVTKLPQVKELPELSDLPGVRIPSIVTSRSEEMTEEMSWSRE